MILLALFRLAFASAPRLYRLTSHHIVTRRPILQKVRHHTRMVLCLLVSSRFQVLFHSPPGVLFTFPSRYSSLSVIWSYLALRDGPRAFRQDSSCPDVLRILLAPFQISPTGFSPSSICLSKQFGYPSGHLSQSLPRRHFCRRFGLLRFRSPLLSESFLLSFPPGTKMFQFPGFPPSYLCVQYAVTRHYSC